MKRNVEPIHEFDMEKFAHILADAIGDRSYSQFAKEAGISFGYVSKYINKKHNVAPTVQTLKKIASVSQGPDYQALLIASGYDIEVCARNDIKETPVASEFPDWSPLNSLVPTLCRTNFAWQIESGDPISIVVEGAPFERWHFIPVVKKKVLKEDISALLGSEKARGIKPGEKITFLTASRDVFEDIATMDLNLISLRISVGYILPRNIIVCDEKYVSTAIELTDTDLVYMLTNTVEDAEGPLFL